MNKEKQFLPYLKDGDSLRGFVDVPKHIVEQGRDAIIKYFTDLANKGTIDLAYSQFSHDTVRLADQTEIKE